MKVVFVSNYFNHHQKPFCEEMYQRLRDDFTFISTSVMREERRKLGYAQDDSPAYVYLAYVGEQQRLKAISLINEADVVIAGSPPNDMLKDRIKAGKLLLRYEERPYKKKASGLRKMYHFIRWRKKDLWKKNVYMLCASAYTALDYASLGLYKNRTYMWGYFPTVREYDVDELMSRKKRNTLMWCGRFIDWKHPDDAIRIAGKLSEAGYNFHLNMIGTGVMEEELKQLTEDLKLGDVVHFLGSMPTERVRGHMEEAGIYLFTSDRQEGWGAVLNESMNSGCAVIASHAIGSVPYLLESGRNGLIYESGNIDQLYEKVKYALDHSEEQARWGKEAYRTVTEEWNVQAAVERLMVLVEKLLHAEKNPDLYQNGPCSRSPVIKDNWFKES